MLCWVLVSLMNDCVTDDDAYYVDVNVCEDDGDAFPHVPHMTNSHHDDDDAAADLNYDK